MTNNLLSTYLHARLDGELAPIPVDDAFWQALSQGNRPELDQGYLLSAFQFAANWTSWERHPAGQEWVCLLSGAVTLLMETPTGTIRHPLHRPGDFAVVPTGVWHTADTNTESVLIFLTPGADTEHRSRTEVAAN